MILGLAPALLLLSPAFTPQDDSDADRKWGHSRHGSAYDEGPRQRPWKMEGIGHTPLEITISNPEVQEWFDQGNALLHGFWWFEAERTFRWCLKLDPECAMAYLGLSRAAQGGERARTFLKEAVKRKERVTDLERRMIELFELRQEMDDADEDERKDATEALVRHFDQLLMDYPEEVEVKALYWLVMPGSEKDSERYGHEAVFRDAFELAPDHVGVLHYRIHNWDGKEGRYAVDSCLRLSEIAPNCGHLQHMPGHVLSGIGLWHEAAIAMDSATRVEKRYMFERTILPEENWNYVHNLDYLTYIQEQLGMYETALLGAKQLLLAPPAPGRVGRQFFQRLPMMRVLLKFERWDTILAGKLLAWDEENPGDEVYRAYAETRAHLGLGDLEKAEESFEALGKTLEPKVKAGKDADPDDRFLSRRLDGIAKRFQKELEARLALARGESLEGIQLLAEVAREQEADWSNDPPHDPVYLYNALGEAYLDLGSPKLAAEAFEKTLETVFHDGFALAGLVQAHAALRNEAEAKKAMATLGVVWSDADPNRWLDAARATGIQAVPHIEHEIEQRNYKKEVLDVLGPSLWAATPAPELAVLSSSGETVSLDDYAGKNLILIFYLGDECLHCMEQIAEADKRVLAFGELDTEILAISKDSVDEIRGYEESGDFKVKLLSDPGFENAIRYRSYDEFEGAELHSTVLIDKSRSIHWSRRGGDPFMDFDFLEAELRRLEKGVVKEILSVGEAR